MSSDRNSETGLVQPHYSEAGPCAVNMTITHPFTPPHSDTLHYELSPKNSYLTTPQGFQPQSSLTCIFTILVIVFLNSSIKLLHVYLSK